MPSCAHGCLVMCICLSIYIASKQHGLRFPAWGYTSENSHNSSQPAPLAVKHERHYIQCFKMHLSNSWHACSFSIMYVRCAMRDAVMFLPLRGGRQAVNTILTNYHRVHLGNVLVISFSSLFAHSGTAEKFLAHFNMRPRFPSGSRTSSVTSRVIYTQLLLGFGLQPKEILFSWTDCQIPLWPLPTQNVEPLQ